MSRVTLLTDFGTADGYVGVLKGVITSLAPGAIIDDISHDIPVGDISAAARALIRYWKHYPPHTVHLIVVDPGVGTGRRGLAAEVEGRLFVSPDNGVLSGVLQGAASWQARSLDNDQLFLDSISTTFHGRDVFAPVAGHLCRGTSLEEVGSAVHDPVLLELVAPAVEAGVIRGSVLSVDHFGNLCTDVKAAGLKEDFTVEIAGQTIRAGRSYGFVAAGALVAVINSEGFVEVAVRDGSAAQLLGSGPGDRVSVFP